jgi:hypothetical protein
MQLWVLEKYFSIGRAKFFGLWRTQRAGATNRHHQPIFRADQTFSFKEKGTSMTNRTNLMTEKTNLMTNRTILVANKTNLVTEKTNSVADRTNSVTKKTN